MSDIVATLHQFPTHGTTAATLDTTDEKGALQLSDTGVGGVNLALNETSGVAVNDLVRFTIGSEVRHAFVVEKIDEHTLDDEEGSKLTRVLSGRGVGALSEWGVVGPANGFGAQPKETDRLFNVYAPQYDISGWDAAVLTANPSVPAEWPDITGATGPYISTTTATPPDSVTPNGASLLGDDFTLADDVAATVFCSADNWADIYIDGQFILKCGGPDADHSYKRTFTAVVLLSAGTHRVMVRLYNKGGDNHGGIRYALAKTSVDGSLTDVLHESSTGWKNLETPSPWPGMTPGQAVLIAVGEIQDRGGLSWMGVDFDEDVDSNGTSWPVVGDISTKTGNSLLQFLLELSATYVDWVVDPDSLTLSLYVKGDYAQVGAPIGGPVTLAPAAVTAADGNVVQLDRTIT